MLSNKTKEKYLDMLYSIYGKVFLYIIFFIGFIYLSYKSYLMFHIIVEMFGITVGFAMAIISINTYKLNKNNRIIFLGIIFGFIAFLDLLHVFSFIGIGSSDLFTFNSCLQLFVVGRFLGSISLLISFTSQGKVYNLKKIILTDLAVIVICLISIFYFNIFPDCYIDGRGFTSFKLIAGYINCIVLLAAFIYLARKTDGELKKNDRALKLSIISSLLCEILFIFSRVSDDLFSVLAHVFQFLLFYYIYIALVQSSLQEPHYSLIKLNNVLINKNKDLENLVHKLELEQEERKKTEYEKERKTEILNGILESVVDGVEVVNEDQKILHANNKFAEMFSIPFDITSETTNGEVIDFVKTQIKDPEEFEDSVKEEWEKEKEHTENLYLENGRILEVSSLPFAGSNLIKGRVIVCRDLTEKIKIQELQKQVEIRQASLEKAREFDELKTDFFSTVSHELKTPISILLAVLQLIESMREKDSQLIDSVSTNKYINIMKQNCYRLIKLTNNLIDINKIDAGYTEMKIKNHNIISVIEDITSSVAEYTESKDISLVFDTDMEERIIACDDEKLERVMLNLLSNAIKFTDAKGTIEINITNKEEYVIISVKDSGIGIPEDKIGTIFDRFVQVDSTLTRKKEGSGIGLSLVKSIVENHGGSISVKSKVGKGSEFTIELPVKLVMGNDAMEEVSATKDLTIDKIDIEFSDIYELNVY